MEEKTIKFTADNQNLFSYNIHYFRYDGQQQEWDIWTWEDGCEGREVDFTGVDQEGFATAIITSVEDHINVITRPGNWSSQEEDRRVEMPEGKREVDVWLIEDDTKVYYSNIGLDTAHRIRAAFMDSFTSINILTTKNIAEEELHQFYIKQFASELSIALQVCKLSERSYSLTVAHGAIDVTKVYLVGHPKLNAAKLVYRNVLDDQQFYYSGEDLGLTYTLSASGFKLWAPTAAGVAVAIYENSGQYNSLGWVDMHSDGQETPMVRNNNGVWSTVITGNLVGKFYMYKLTFADWTVNYVVDPYARAVGANGARAAIIDMKSTDPEGWTKDRKPSLMEANDAIIYELHVRDFSINESSGVTPCNRGKFAAFTEAGLTDEYGNKLGIDHLVELGITHVHLLPVYDFQTVNELTVDDPSSAERKYNWGYDPQNYNVPEGSYSSDVSNASARISEFKRMVKALHDKGIRVVMDVVYNHTYSIKRGPFQNIVPGYFYRTKANGAYSNGSGCGNELATERPMVSKFIKESVRYWAKEYHIDGFRFDLMGLIDVTTMKELTEELHSKVDASILIYGEPWVAASTTLPYSEQTLKGTQRDSQFAVFNDHFRNAIKGDSDSIAKGFATGNVETLDVIAQGVRGAIDDFTNAASESINYVTAHDNLNLWDKIVKTQGLFDELNMLHMKNGALIGGGDVAEAVAHAKPYLHVQAGNVLGNETVKRSLLANGIVLTSQGIPFIHAGDEFLRSKYGDHNSYRSSDLINGIDWRNKEKFKDVYRYYQGLIKLRREHPAFRMSSRHDINNYLHILYQHDGVLAFRLGDHANFDTWKNIIVIYNGKDEPRELLLPESTWWHVVVNGNAAGTKSLTTVSGTVKVDAISMMVLYEEGDLSVKPFSF